MVRSFVRALTLASALVIGGALPAMAQSPTPGAKGGHPWHWWMALGSLGLAGLFVLAVVLGLAVQGPNFNKVQHKQGQPR